MPKISTTVGEKDINMTVKEEILALTPRGNGKQIRLDLATWNGNDYKYELRIWSNVKTGDGEVFKATKGLGLTGAELLELRDKLNELDFES